MDALRKAVEQARTWVNQELRFTHGYGVAIVFVSKTMGETFRSMFREYPAGIRIWPDDQPAFHLLRRVRARLPNFSTGIKEFDYPKGNENVYTRYGGTGGIPLDLLIETGPLRLDPSRCKYFLLPLETRKHDSALETRSRRVRQIARS